MNGRLAKKIRKSVYGDKSLKGPKQYFHKKDDNSGQIFRDLDRQLYQKTKKAWTRGQKV